MMEMYNGGANPCNTCVHTNCCKYIDDIQKAVKEMNSVRQVQIDEKVFELSTIVTFRCDVYLEEK